MGVDRVDVLIVTALRDELQAVLALGDGRGIGWSSAGDEMSHPFHHREFMDEAGRPLRVAAAWLGDTGNAVAAVRTRKLVEWLTPVCVAMCGICAGNRERVFLGDVIVADYVYSYDPGKLVAAVDESDEETSLYHIETYVLDTAWKINAASFAQDFQGNAELIAHRPPSREGQALWLRHVLYTHEQGGPSPLDHPDRSSRCPDWRAVVLKLSRKGIVDINSRNLQLSERGRAMVMEERLLYPDGLPTDPPFRVHIGPIASSNTILADPQVFSRTQRSMPRTTLGIEMEAAGTFHAAHERSRRSIVVKAVVDYADEEKDDSFRAFACRASAEFLLGFLRRYFDPRGVAEATGASEPESDLPPITLEQIEFGDSRTSRTFR